MKISFNNTNFYVLYNKKHSKVFNRYFSLLEFTPKDAISIFFSLTIYDNKNNINNFVYYDINSRLLLLIYDDINNYDKPFDNFIYDKINEMLQSEVNYDNIINPKHIKLINIKHFIKNIESKHKQLNNIAYSTLYMYYHDKFKYNIRFNLDYYYNDKIILQCINLKLMDFDNIKESLLSLFDNINSVYELNDNQNKIFNLISKLKIPIKIYHKTQYTITDVINTNAFIKNIDNRFINLALEMDDYNEDFLNFKKTINNFIIDTHKKDIDIQRKTLNVKGFRFYVKDCVTIKYPLFIDLLSMDDKEKIVFCWLTRFDKLKDLYSLIQLSKLEIL